jgi:son of sevenless-like protein
MFADLEFVGCRSISLSDLKIGLQTRLCISARASYYISYQRALKYETEPDDNIVRSDWQDSTSIDYATLPKLIEYITKPDLFDNDTARVLVTAYLNVINASSLLSLLIRRFDTPPPPDYDFELFVDKVLTKVRSNIVSILLMWLEMHPYDFTDKLMFQLAKFIDDMRYCHCKDLADKLSMTIATLEWDRKLVVVGQPPKVIKISRTIFTRSKKFQILDYDALEIARQITLIDNELFCKIARNEFAQSNYAKENRPTRAPNLAALITSFNKMYSWIGSEIVKRETVEERVKIICKFLEIGSHLLSLNNLFALFAVTSSYIQRPFTD